MVIRFLAAAAAVLTLAAPADAHSRAHKKHHHRAIPRVLPVPFPPPLPRPRPPEIMLASPFEGQVALFWHVRETRIWSMCQVEVIQAPAPAGHADSPEPAPRLMPWVAATTLAAAVIAGGGIGGWLAWRRRP